ncbi:U8-agatoxin-Ao1a isoform X1 [Papilio machaon]|uniref:U8-agatoxin-Ao1a isoform X1 n=1 Tax=Papilio machaon TaxID=76193 RepID=UPI001E662F09|nr:U8-agatoxin-Ao1a isoform X1 [Papilio machaon]
MPRAGAMFLALAAALLAVHSADASYIDPGDDDVDLDWAEYVDPNELQNLRDVGKRSSLIYVFRRACIPRGGNCDHRPGDCCHSSSCRCNLWGSNCRCQRMGLFQKWG